MLPTDESPHEIDGRFRLESERVAGGMGMVYRGVDLSTGETVAVKISSGFGSQLGERFQQEANCLAAIAHPAIVRYIAHGKTVRGEHYLVMEWLDGETLEDRLSKGAISLGATVQMVRRVAEALAVAHQHGVIHRDIKPANIFLPGGDMAKIKLLDFGIARRLFDPVALRLTQAGSALGTPMYMSPEQAQGSLDVDARADVFSLGCVFFECLTGESPFIADSTTGTLARVADAEDIDVEGHCGGVPPRLTALLHRMLAKQADRRPATMTEVLEELGRLTGELRTTGVYPIVAKERRPANDASLLVGTGERRLVAIIVLSDPTGTTSTVELDPAATLTDLGNVLARNLSDAEFDDDRINMLSSEIASFGARILKLANGAVVVTLTGEGQGTPLDLAARSARCALKLKVARPGSALGVSLGHAVKDEELDTRQLIEEARKLLSKQHLGSIHITDEIKRLLEGRFEIVSEPDGRARLLFEKGLREAPRTILGKEIPCLGRDREVRELEGLFESCVEEPLAQAVVVSGAAGCGKSRVAYEFLERMRDSGHGFELLIGRGDPMRINVSLGLLAQALRGACGISGNEAEDIQRKRLYAHTSRFLPPSTAATTVAFLGEIANVRFPDDGLPQLQAARQDARLMADQTIGAWVDWLEAESEHHPILLLLEDLHWGDFASVNYVDAALRVLRKKALMVLALARPEVDERFYGLWRDRHVQRISLAPLGNRAGQELIRRVLGDTAPETMTWLLDHAQGNPFYLEELVRAVHTHGGITEVPPTVLGTVQVRFDAVGEGSKLVLRAASVFGQSFYAAGVKALLGEMSDEDVDRWLEILVEREILFARPVGQSRQHVFRHALLYQAAYAMLSPKDEEAGHFLAGDYLESTGERDAMVLADHFEKGNKPERAIRWLRVAASQAMEVDDLGAAIERVDRAVRLGAREDDLAELRLVESEARFWKGEYVEAERAAREATRAKDSRLWLRAMSALINALGPEAKYDEIRHLADALTEPPQRSELLNAWLDCRVNSASYLVAAGHFQARGEILQLLEGTSVELDPVLLGRAETARAHLARMDGKPAEFITRMRRAWDIFDRAGQKRVGIEVLGNAVVALVDLGQLDDAEVEARKLLAIAERMSLNHIVGGALYVLMTILAYRGLLAEARKCGERAIKVTAETNDQHFRRYTQLYLSLVEYMAKDFMAAERHARLALDLVENNPSLRPLAWALLARSLLGQGRTQEALEHARTAHAHLEEQGRVQDGEIIIQVAFAECLSAAGCDPPARDVIRDSIAKLRERAATIDNRDWCRSFLMAIPENRRAIELARRLEVVEVMQLEDFLSSPDHDPSQG